MAYKDEDWRDEARCFGIEDPEIFFPVRDKDTYKDVALEAKAVCFGPNGKTPCAVREHCLWYAIENDEQHGIWGGLSHRERNALVRKWQKKYKNQMTLKEYVFQANKIKENK